MLLAFLLAAALLLNNGFAIGASLLLSNCDHFKIFRLTVGCPICIAIMGRPELFQITAQSSLPGIIECSEGAIRGAIIRAVELHDLCRWEGITERV
jgi:hypothetical protein